MLRSPFRHKSSKEPRDEGSSTQDKDDACYTFKELEDSDGNSFEDTVESIDSSLNEAQNPGDLNRNVLTKIYNPSLDDQLDTVDQNNFPYTERDIYEMQLVQLQEQLVAIMIQDQEKSK